MFDSVFTDIAIGLLLMYLLLSMLCTACNELIATVLNMRGKMLLEGLKNGFESLGDPKMTQLIMLNPLVQSLYRKGRLPGYISPRVFAQAAQTALARTDPTFISSIESKLHSAKSEYADAVRTHGLRDQRTSAAKEAFDRWSLASRLAGEQLARAEAAGSAKLDSEEFAVLAQHWRQGEQKLTGLLAGYARFAPGAQVIGSADLANGFVAKAVSGVQLADSTDVKADIEAWFDDVMERVSGWYKRRMQIVSLIVATALVVILNADTVRMVQTIRSEPALRAALVAAAADAVQETQTQASPMPNPGTLPMSEDNLRYAQAYESSLNVDSMQRLSEHLDDVELPFGWERTSVTFTTVVGWILTILAISLGAPFWFDMLSKITRVRGSGEKPSTPNAR